MDIGTIEIDKTSDSYIKLLHITRERKIALSNAQTYDEIEKMRIAREENQFAQHMKTKSENYNVYKFDKQAEVGVASAEALGKMCENGAENVNLGGSVGFNPMSMMTGITLGGVVANNIAGTMKKALNGEEEQIYKRKALYHHPFLKNFIMLLNKISLQVLLT